MKSRPKPLLICISGFPGAGKGVFKKAADRLGLKTIVMGDYVRRKTKEIHGSLSLRNIKETMLQLRKKYGEDIVAKYVADDLNKISANFIIIDGVRSMAEVNYFKNIANVVLIWVHASPVTRYKRLILRGREGDVKNIRDLMLRENVEKQIGLNELMENADIYFINEGIDEEEAISSACILIKSIIEKFRYK